MLNVPVLLRLVRRLVPSAGAIKTTAAIVAVGAVSTVGGRELAARLVQAHRHRAALVAARSDTVPVAPILHRHVSLVPASRGRAPQPRRSVAPPTAEAAVTDVRSIGRTSPRRLGPRLGA